MASSKEQQYKQYYDMIMSLPFVKSLLKKNKKLEKKYKKEKIKNKALQTILYDLSYVKSPANKIRKIGKLRKDKFDLLNNNIVVKKEFVDDDEISVTDVIFIGENMNKKENIVYDLVDDEDGENELNEGFDEDDEKAIEVITSLKNELKTNEPTTNRNQVEKETDEREGASEGTVGSLEEEEEEEEEVEEEEEEVEEEEEEEVEEEEEEEVEEEEEEEVEEEEEEEVEEEEAEEEEAEEEEAEEEEAEEEEVEEEEAEEEEAEEEEVEEEVEEEEVEEEEVEEEEVEEEEEEEGASEGTLGSLEPEEEMEVEEVIVNGKKYYTTNVKNGIIYEVLPDDDIGPEIGAFKDGKAKFYKK